MGGYYGHECTEHCSDTCESEGGPEGRARRDAEELRFLRGSGGGSSFAEFERTQKALESTKRTLLAANDAILGLRRDLTAAKDDIRKLEVLSANDARLIAEKALAYSVLEAKLVALKKKASKPRKKRKK